MIAKPQLSDDVASDAFQARPSSPPRPKRGAERRRAKRILAEFRWRSCSAARQQSHRAGQGRVRDVSATGVGVISDEPLPVGQKFVVKEPTIISKQNSVLYTVVRAERIPLAGRPHRSATASAFTPATCSTATVLSATNPTAGSPSTAWPSC
jgi:hypothetical protein